MSLNKSRLCVDSKDSFLYQTQKEREARKRKRERDRRETINITKKKENVGALGRKARHLFRCHKNDVEEEVEEMPRFETLFLTSPRKLTLFFHYNYECNGE